MPEMITVQIDRDRLISYLVENLTVNELVAFVKDLDYHYGQASFTHRAALHFVAQLKPFTPDD